MNEKIAFVCNANCKSRNESTDGQMDFVKSTLESKGYDIRTRGCLQICADIAFIDFPVTDSDIVNVELHDGRGGVKRAVAGMNGDVIGVRLVSSRS